MGMSIISNSTSMDVSIRMSISIIHMDVKMNASVITSTSARIGRFNVQSIYVRQIIQKRNRTKRAKEKKKG